MLTSLFLHVNTSKALKKSISIYAKYFFKKSGRTFGLPMSPIFLARLVLKANIIADWPFFKSLISLN